MQLHISKSMGSSIKKKKRVWDQDVPPSPICNSSCHFSYDYHYHIVTISIQCIINQFMLSYSMT